MNRRLTLALLLLAWAQPAAAQNDLTGLDALFARWDRPDTPGCAVGVDRRGQDPIRRAYGLAELEHAVPARPDTIYEAGSVSKQFTAAAVLLLADEGRLSLDDDVRRHIPELPDYGAVITVRMLLAHLSGLRDWGSVAAIEGWPRGTRASTNDTVVAILSRQSELNFAPGAEWSYSNSGYNLAAVIVQRVSGASLADYSRRRIFAPLGMDRTRWRDDHQAIVPDRAEAYAPGPDGWRRAMPFENAHGNGGLLTTVDDLLTWNRALDDDWMGLRTRLEARGRIGERRTHYGLGLFHAERAGQAEIGHSGSTGGYRAWLARYPGAGLSVAVLCNTADARPDALGPEMAALFLPTGPEATADAPTGRAPVGLFASTRTGEPFRLRPTPDGGAATAQGARLRPVGPGLYALGDDRLDVVSDDDFDRLTPDGDRIRYRRVEPADPGPERLAALAGAYVSDDARATLSVAVRDGRLVLAHAGLAASSTPQPLTSAYGDVFSGPPGHVTFERDEAGRGVALHINNGRVRKMTFRRAP